jgi:intein/homing endonuclease
MDLGQLALDAGRMKAGTSRPVVDIITFVEAAWGLDQRLFPVQRVILKAHYGLELDDNPHDFPLDEPVPKDHPAYDPDLMDKDGFYALRVVISDFRRENWRVLTEAGYLRYLYDTKRCNHPEVIPGVERREMILSIGRRSGKCVLGDTLVLTDQGVRRIDALGDPDGPEVQPLVVGVAQEGAAKSESKYFYNGGVRDTRTLTTHCGFRLGGTDNHRIKVLTEDGVVEWKYLADLRVGDVVCVHRGTNLWAAEYVDCTPFHNEEGRKDLPFPARLDEEWGRLLGYLVGDGLWNYHNRVEVTVEHGETWDTLKGLYTDLLGSYSISMDKRTENTGAIKFNSVGMRRFLHDLGLKLDTERDAKMVPWAIMQSPRSVVQAFLRGLFETDGGVEAGGKVVSFSSASERLAREVQTLLLNLGIVSRVRAKPVKGKDYWVLTVRGLRSRAAFAERVGFDSRKKMDPLWASLKTASREGGDAESIPHQRAWARRMLESVPKVTSRPGVKQAWSRSALRDVLGNTIKPSSTEQVTYPRLERALSVAQEIGASAEVLEHFHHLVELDYFYDPVESIEEGQHRVYDLHVPEGESFVANGMTNHNTFISSCIAAYETYKLVSKGHPQGYYGLPDSNVIQIISVATDKDQAGLLYREVHGHYVNCSFFEPYMANATQSFATFQTPQDIDRFGAYADNPKARFSIKVTFRSCVAKGLRGAGNIVVILDEVAHFTDAGQSGAEEVYNAVTPSTSAFSPKDPNDARIPTGPVEGRIVLISSPLGKQGQFYKLFQIGMRGGAAAENMLCIEAPTWEVNPTVPASEFAKHYAKDPRVFDTEYGGRFTDRTRGWIEEERDLLACVDPMRRAVRRASPRKPHFAGLDIAQVGDRCAIAIGHVEGDKVVADTVAWIQAGEGDFEHVARLDYEDIVDWIYDWSRKFYIVDGIFDQWCGIVFEQAMAKRGLKQFHMVTHTKPLTSAMWKNFKDMMFDQRLVLYDDPIPEGKPHCDYIAELLELQEERHSKYVVTVEAPQVEGKYDDTSDALNRMIWSASQHLGKAVSFGQSRRTERSSAGLAQKQHVQAVARAKVGGSHPSRQMPQLPRGGSRGGSQGLGLGLGRKRGGKG